MRAFCRDQNNPQMVTTRHEHSFFFLFTQKTNPGRDPAAQTGEPDDDSTADRTYGAGHRHRHPHPMAVTGEERKRGPTGQARAKAAAAGQ